MKNRMGIIKDIHFGIGFDLAIDTTLGWFGVNTTVGEKIAYMTSEATVTFMGRERGDIANADRFPVLKYHTVQRLLELIDEAAGVHWYDAEDEGNKRIMIRLSRPVHKGYDFKVICRFGSSENEIVAWNWDGHSLATCYTGNYGLEIGDNLAKYLKDMYDEGFVIL